MCRIVHRKKRIGFVGFSNGFDVSQLSHVWYDVDGKSIVCRVDKFEWS